MALLIGGLCLGGPGCTSPDSPSPLVSESDTVRISVGLAGDLMVHGQQLTAARRAFGQYEFGSVFRYSREMIEGVDLAVVNLETTLPGSPPYSGYPTFRTPNALGYALKNAGFDLVATANNHANDAGSAGVVNTLQTLRKTGFYQMGTWMDEADRKSRQPLLIEVQGVKLAFLNYTYPASFLTTRGEVGIGQFTEEQVREDFQNAHQQAPDYILVFLHWGEEYAFTPSAEQRFWAQQLFRWGADAVVGSHPHVVQPVERYAYREADGGKVSKVVAYSLGNFLSNQRRPGTETGLWLELEITHLKSQGKTYLSNCKVEPVFRRIRRNHHRRTFRIIPANCAGRDSLLTDEEINGLEELRKNWQIKEVIQ